MKKITSLLFILVAFVSCTEDVKLNNPSIQGLKDDVLWRANDSRAYVASNGSLTIEGYTENEILTLNTTSTNPGRYFMGSANQANQANYILASGAGNVEYETAPVPSAVNFVTLSAGGAGYAAAVSVATTGGTGSGLKVNIKRVNASGVITEIGVTSPGSGYLSGDIITISGGNGLGKCIVNLGEIVIEEYDPINMTITGSFRFNASNVDNNPAGPAVVNFQKGHFYKVPIYPSL